MVVCLFLASVYHSDVTFLINTAWISVQEVAEVY